MATSTYRNSSSSQDSAEIVEAAEKRAEIAEHRAEVLEERLQALENASASKTPDNPAGSADDPAAPPASQSPSEEKAITALRNEPMMNHLLNALSQGQDIGHYGRLVFAMVARHFLPEEAMLEWLSHDRDFSAEQAETLLRQVEGRDYNPPRRER